MGDWIYKIRGLFFCVFSWILGIVLGAGIIALLICFFHIILIVVVILLLGYCMVNLMRHC
jgi:hypothetical protein